MSIRQEIHEFLNECGVFYFGTVDGDAPVIRPLGFQMMHEGELYFGIGTFKSAYKQLVANPNVYICALKPDGSGWLRVSAKAVCDHDPALVDACFEHMPDLKGLYEANGWEMGIFHLTDATATFVEGPMTPIKTEQF